MVAVDDADEGLPVEHNYRELERQIAVHPGYLTHLECEVLKRSHGYVFEPNSRELLALLDRASTDPELALELVQNVHEPEVRDQFHGDLTRCLHNYVAGTVSLADHVRYIMRTPSGELVPDFEDRKAQFLLNPEIPFVKDLRNFVLHRTLPVFAHSVTVGKVNTPEQTMTSEVELNVPDLCRWKGWTSTSKNYLAWAGNQIVLRPLIRKHGDLVYSFNWWIYRTLQIANQAALDEVNALIVRRNAIWANVDIATAERMTDRGFAG